jgi:hypothetical protein
VGLVMVTPIRSARDIRRAMPACGLRALAERAGKQVLAAAGFRSPTRVRKLALRRTAQAMTWGRQPRRRQPDQTALVHPDLPAAAPVAVSAIGLGATGLAELLLAVLTGSVRLLGDAIRYLFVISLWISADASPNNSSRREYA